MKEGLTADQVREILSYNPETGIFRWKVSKGRRVRVGDQAGCCYTGYVIIRLNGWNYRAHRLAYLVMTGNWPTMALDHRNRDRLDNRWSNLRLATDSQNAANSVGMGNKNALGLKGVRKHRDGGFYASIRVNKRAIHLGRFLNPEAAHDAYKAAAERYFGEFASLEA